MDNRISNTSSTTAQQQASTVNVLARRRTASMPDLFNKAFNSAQQLSTKNAPAINRAASTPNLAYELPFPFNDLPNVLILKSMKYLDHKSLGRLAQTDKKNNALVQEFYKFKQEVDKDGVPFIYRMIEDKVPLQHLLTYINHHPEEVKLTPKEEKLLKQDAIDLKKIKSCLKDMEKGRFTQLLTDFIEQNKFMSEAAKLLKEKVQFSPQQTKLLKKATLAEEDIIEIRTAKCKAQLLNVVLGHSMYAGSLVKVFSRNGDLLKALIQNGANVNVVGEEGQTPLRLAVLVGSVEIVKMLIDKGAKVNAVDKKNRTPFFLAIGCEKLKFAEILIDNGADVNFVYEEGLTPLHLALEIDKPSPKFVEKLIQKGANVNVVDEEGQTPLHKVLQSLIDGDISKDDAINIVDTLITNGANIDLPDSQGKTPQDFARRLGYKLSPPQHPAT